MEDIASAKARGARFGRPVKEKPENYLEELNCWKQNKVSAQKAARLLNVSTKTFLKWTHKCSDQHPFLIYMDCVGKIIKIELIAQ